MACNCGEKSSCACTFTSTSTVSINGGGTTESPIIISIDTVSFTAESTESVLVSLGGDGSVTDPYALSMRLAPEIMDSVWGKWIGTQAEYDAIPHLPGTIYAVSGPTRHLPGVDNLYIGTERVVRVYVGSVMIADDAGSTLGPGT